MMVVVRSDPDAATIDQIDDLKSLAVSACTDVWPRLDCILRDHRLGRFDGSHAWLDIDALRGAVPVTDRAWHQSFNSMMQYAEKNEWVSADHRSVRAHCIQAD